MAGKLILSRYKAEDGRVFFVKIQPETALLSFGSQQNAPTVDPVDQKGFLKIRRDVREIGLKSRKVGLTWDSNPPNGYARGRIVYVPILTPVIYSAISLGQGCTYLGTTATVSSLIPERG